MSASPPARQPRPSSQTVVAVAATTAFAFIVEVVVVALGVAGLSPVVELVLVALWCWRVRWRWPLSEGRVAEVVFHVPVDFAGGFVEGGVDVCAGVNVGHGAAKF